PPNPFLPKSRSGGLRLLLLESRHRDGGGAGRQRDDDGRISCPPLTLCFRVNVPSHPLIKHWISVLRNEQTPCATFKSAMAELGRLLIYEASRDWLVCQSMRRDEMTLEPSLYLNKLPDKFQEGSHILLIDPMLATGVLLFNGVLFTILVENYL
ncbi:hypothetical protein B296_00000051, partial [Ensete ventricosum]